MEGNGWSFGNGVGMRFNATDFLTLLRCFGLESIMNKEDSD